MTVRADLQQVVAPAAADHDPGHRRPRRVDAHLGETGPLSQGVQARRKALRIRHRNGMEVRKKMPRGSKRDPGGSSEPPEPPISAVAPQPLTSRERVRIGAWG
jgi:hypothetical protein